MNKPRQRRWQPKRGWKSGDGKKFGGRAPQVPDPAEAKPEAKAQRNFTDPDSRILLDGAARSFVQGYNGQAAVDSHAQIIVAAVTQEANDKKQWMPMLRQVEQNLGRKPEHTTADSGYFSEAALSDPSGRGTELLVPPDRQKHGSESAAHGEMADEVSPVAEGQPSQTADETADPAPVRNVGDREGHLQEGGKR